MPGSAASSRPVSSPGLPRREASDRSDASLAAQYEAYPYPARDPREEARRLVIGSPSHLREIDHWVFGAARPQSRALRVLVAGCGTGDGAIMLAQQLAAAGRPGQVLCIDRSAHALRIAADRAQARGLGNIAFRAASLLDLPRLGIGPFDYIDCCGVLHHLPDPLGTLADLRDLLAPGGGIGVMVYAPHGRTGVYMLQDALARLAPAGEPPAMRLDIARRTMRHLPATAWLRANSNFGDHLSGGDAGLYDLLLNARDRAYDIPALYRLLDGAGLEVAALIEPARYDPALLLPDAKLRARIEALPQRERAAIAEALAGNMNTHIAYVLRAGTRPAMPDALDPGAVAIAREIPAAELARRIGPDGALAHQFGQLTVRVPLPPQARALLGLIDGERSIAATRDIMQGRGLGAPQFETAWRQTFETLAGLNRILFRAPC